MTDSTLAFDPSAIAVRPLSPWTRLWNITAFRRGTILVLLALVWEGYGRLANNPLMFPTFTDTAVAFYDALVHGTLLKKSQTSLEVLLMGYGIGSAIALVLAGLAASTRIGEDVLATLTAMFNPLPAIALLPLALLWFGLGTPSLLFVLVHAVLWPLALNASAGFSSVPETLRMAGRNYGLTGWRYIALILIPAAFPAILTGLKVGWAFAWRTLIAAELVFGVASGSGGLGWFIFENKNRLETASVFAGLGTVIIIGLLVESLVFRVIERHTIRKWGMQR
ncbi:ABC transporter permease [Magnetospirillum fulvum]|jgi:NitT/TauT family transport system permease protein|uniref:NitT/TauT family transport system permease protein n=1 Tax=Magnetospirillum fulvum TaxID=1082 RepID=A0A1H6GUK7_MAGFU|nr:ABC transporter permease [Magnetospirillum fulvum]SEH25533.1 NitT/TauT family transport system permease protein [Magnetospirillum fulvum]